MTQPVYFVSHGGGPWPYMPEAQAMYALLTESLRAMPSQLPRRPDAILMISAHWETQGALAVMTHPQPPMLYDYYGFPEHTYKIRYAAPGSPELARRTSQLLQSIGPVHEDAERGFDHGAFVPLYVMYPEADIPVTQLSIEKHFDPALHVAIGRALAPLRDENVLIVCSGLSYHNLREIRSIGALPSAQFDAWLQQVVVQGPIDERIPQLLDWEQAPAARQAHPREDHLIPLMVAAGAAEHDPATCVYHDKGLFAGITASSFRFG
ncbi:dioxygenase [Pusillimonas sp. CC-YST705]|uniref:Dioxygenase n=1 Tax=Mesopusillimonas faecipullorum TaxID=2755040 RepID=A0ABS8CCD9_9BURK|nr:class III extradiol ring-cleavage dioxygenase [Mesopusillimonas faecipullorum]MCB5363705.1 dioxygenase [Mesopusillimonas faecipullorum]